MPPWPFPDGANEVACKRDISDDEIEQMNRKPGAAVLRVVLLFVS